MDYALVDNMGDVWAYFDTSTPDIAYLTTDSEDEPFSQYALNDFDEITTQRELQTMITFKETVMKIKLSQLKQIIREVLETVQENTARELGNDPSKLEEYYPEAYEALPTPYKSDRALTFYVDVNGNLCADHDLGGSFMWNETKWVRFE